MKRRQRKKLKPTRGSLRVVFNTSLLIALVTLGLLRNSIDSLFSEAQVPRGVIVELERKHDNLYSHVKALLENGQLRIEEVSHVFPQLGLGESSAILVALNKGKVVVLDDKKARKLARELGLNVIGTLAILQKLYELGLLKMTKEELYIRLLNLGFYIKQGSYNKIFRDVEG